MPMPPLGRSLIPLPGESLPGFILRLSCRLQLPPARLAALTGLVPAGHSGARAPVSLLTEIPEPARRTFAHMTRLTTDKVAQLGLACLQEQYPLPAGAAKNVATVPLSGLLVFAPATRYCPDCLAGDGSPIQDAFGGPWRKIWHLPVVFACTLHQRLLEDRCPECGQVTHSRYLGAPVPMLPAMRAGTLHPSQCRTALDPGRGRTLPTCCGTRLDHTPSLRPADPELITLQHKILGLLGPGGPAHTLSAGRPADPARYFTDLQALALLACSTWPAIRHLSPSQETARPSTGMSRHFGNEPQTGRAAPGPQKSAPLSDPPPTDAAASAGLAHIADHILLSGGPAEVREHLRPLLPASTRQASRTAWGLRVFRSTTPCSEGLQAAYTPLLRGFTKIRRPAASPARRGLPPAALGTRAHPGVPPQGLVRPPLQAARRRQSHAHPPHRGAPAGADGRRRLARRSRRVPRHRSHRHHLATQKPDLLRRRSRPQQRQEAV